MVTQLTTIILGRRKSIFIEEKKGNRTFNKLNWFVHIQTHPSPERPSLNHAQEREPTPLPQLLLSSSLRCKVQVSTYLGNT